MGYLRKIIGIPRQDHPLLGIRDTGYGILKEKTIEIWDIARRYIGIFNVNLISQDFLTFQLMNNIFKIKQINND